MTGVSNEERAALVRKTIETLAVDTFDARGEGVALCDMEHRIREVNSIFCDLTGCEHSALIGGDMLQVLESVVDARAEEIERIIARAREDGSTIRTENALAIRGSADTCTWVIPSMTVVRGPAQEYLGLELTLRDISQLMSTREALEQNEQKYRELVNNVNSVIIRFSPARRIIFVNRYAETFFGRSARELVGQDVIGTVFPAVDGDGHDITLLVDEMVASPELHGQLENEAIAEHGRHVWIHWSNRAIRDARGDVQEIICVGTDVTERKRLEREAYAYRHRLRALADRLSAKEEQERRRLATYLHDTVIQTLSLSSIRLASVVNAIEKAGLDTQRDRLEGVRDLLDQGGRECRRLMEQLAPSLLYEVGLGAALRDLAERMGRTDGTQISVEESGAQQPLDDTLRNVLFQSARELLMNALKYAGHCEITITLSFSESWVRLRIEDTGEGFDTGVLSGNADRRDGGFGLFNIRERVEGLGGELAVMSAPGEGTDAVVRVPLPSA